MTKTFHRDRLKTAQAKRIYDSYMKQITDLSREHYCIENESGPDVSENHRKAVLAAWYDPPEVFWFCEVRRTGSPRRCDPERIALIQWHLEHTLNWLTCGTEYFPPLDRVKMFDARIMAMGTYHNGEPEDYEITGPVMFGSGCCSGYAKLFKLALDKAKVGPSVIVCSATHAWNAVCINGEYRHFDVTFGRSAKDTACRRYFNLSTEQVRTYIDIETELEDVKYA